MNNMKKGLINLISAITTTAFIAFFLGIVVMQNSVGGNVSTLQYVGILVLTIITIINYNVFFIHYNKMK